MVLTRHEFTQWIKLREPRLATRDSPVWSIETRYCRPGWFVKVAPKVRTRASATHEEYWDWCSANLKGKLLCYWSDPEKGAEWWGFTEKDDITLWILRWT
jgi:hypothetical protein